MGVVVRVWGVRREARWERGDGKWEMAPAVLMWWAGLVGEVIL